MYLLELVVVVLACCYISAIIMLGGDVSESRELVVESDVVNSLRMNLTLCPVAEWRKSEP